MQTNGIRYTEKRQQKGTKNLERYQSVAYKNMHSVGATVEKHAGCKNNLLLSVAYIEDSKNTANKSL